MNGIKNDDIDNLKIKKIHHQSKNKHYENLSLRRNFKWI